MKFLKKSSLIEAIRVEDTDEFAAGVHAFLSEPATVTIEKPDRIVIQFQRDAGGSTLSIGSRLGNWLVKDSEGIHSWRHEDFVAVYEPVADSE